MTRWPLNGRTRSRGRCCAPRRSPGCCRYRHHSSPRTSPRQLRRRPLRPAVEYDVGFPHGFEVQVTGPSSARQVLLHLVVASTNRSGHTAWRTCRWSSTPAICDFWLSFRRPPARRSGRWRPDARRALIGRGRMPTLLGPSDPSTRQHRPYGTEPPPGARQAGRRFLPPHRPVAEARPRTGPRPVGRCSRPASATTSRSPAKS
jgi:hypothetical protein